MCDCFLQFGLHLLNLNVWFPKKIIALVAAAEQEVAKHRQQAWSECLLSTGLCGTESLGKAVAISPLMGALSASTMINSMAKTENSTLIPFDATNPMTSGNASGNTEHTNEAIDRTDSTLPGVRQSSPPPLEAISSSSRLSSSAPIAAESGHEDFIDGSVWWRLIHCTPRTKQKGLLRSRRTKTRTQHDQPGNHFLFALSPLWLDLSAW